MLEAIDAGRDLTGALARYYGISRGLVRAPVCATMWGATALSHRRLLRLLNGIPAHRRPRHPDEFELATPLLITINLSADDQTDLEHLGRTAFRDGLAAVCTPLHERFAPLGPAFADCMDFIRAARARAAQLARRPRGLTEHRLQLAWIEARGFRSLLAASQRWHARAGDADERDAVTDDPTRLMAILGDHRQDQAQARELCTAADLLREGAEMHHCVAAYWSKCCTQGTRVFALALGSATGGERATAEYQFARPAARFTLVQLRGPCNAPASRPMAAFARTVQAALNAPERAAARAELAQALDTRPPPGPPAPRRPLPPLDPVSERELAAVLAYLHPPAPDGELLCEFIAGYQYHGGPEMESQMRMGDTLDLVREPANHHDPQAVALWWRGERLGYVPRRRNSEIARRLDAGELLDCRLTRLHDRAAPWERVEFAVREVRGP